MTDTPAPPPTPPTPNGWMNEDTTDVRIRIEELRARQREHRRDIREHDGKIETLQGQVARVDERVKFLTRALWLVAAALTAGLASGFGAVLRHMP